MKTVFIGVDVCLCLPASVAVTRHRGPDSLLSSRWGMNRHRGPDSLLSSRWGVQRTGAEAVAGTLCAAGRGGLGLALTLKPQRLPLVTRFHNVATPSNPQTVHRLRTNLTNQTTTAYMYVCVPHVCSTQRGQKVSHHVDAGNKARSSGEAAVLLFTEPSLQPQ